MTTATGDPPPYYWPGQQPMQNHLLPPAQTIHLVLHLSPETATLLHGLNSGILAAITELKETIMETLATLQTAVTAEDTVIDSAVTLIQGLAAQVAALAPNQAAIDALAADIKGKSDALAAAVTANTPAV